MKKLKGRPSCFGLAKPVLIIESADPHDWVEKAALHISICFEPVLTPDLQVLSWDRIPQTVWAGSDRAQHYEEECWQPSRLSRYLHGLLTCRIGLDPYLPTPRLPVNFTWGVTARGYRKEGLLATAKKHGSNTPWRD